MNKISLVAFCAALAVVPFQAYALDFTPDPSRVLTDPAYLPLRGQVGGVTGYTYTNTKGHSYDSAGVQSNSSTVKANNESQTVFYGITDAVSVSVSDAYAQRTRETDPVSGVGITTAKSNGFTNPAISGTVRVLDQKTNPVSLDVFGSYSPDAIDLKQATPTNDGTVSSGDYIASAGGALSYKMHDFTIYGSGSAVYSGDQTVTNQTTGLTTKYGSSAHWDYVASLQTQTRFTNRFSVNAGVAETFKGNINDSYINGAGTFVQHTASPSDITTVNASLNYALLPNKLIASAVYAHDFYNGNSENTYAITPASNTTNRNQSSDRVGARLSYVFN